MLFEQILPHLRIGGKAQRAAWNNPHLWVNLQYQFHDVTTGLPFFYMVYPTKPDGSAGSRVPWNPSNTDLLSGDWSIS